MAAAKEGIIIPSSVVIMKVPELLSVSNGIQDIQFISVSHMTVINIVGSSKTQYLPLGTGSVTSEPGLY